MPFIFPASGVNLDYFTDNHASGGEGGSPFTFIKLNEGAILESLTVWKRDWRIRGLRVYMSNGETYNAGKREGESSYFKFRDGERITVLNIQASGPYSSILSRRRLGAIWFKTNKGREWGIFSRNLTEDGRFWPDVGSGVCCGIFGGKGDSLDRLGFAMLRPVERSVLCDVKYPYLNMEIVATKPKEVVHQVFKNCTGGEQTFTLTGKSTVTLKREWSISSTLAMSFSLEVSAGIPAVATVSSKLGWEVSVTSTHTQSETITEEKGWSWPLKCKPHTIILGEATMYADEIDTDYEGKIELKLKNGRSFKYNIKGKYKGLNARSGTVHIRKLGPCYPNVEDDDEEGEVFLWDIEAARVKEDE